MAGKIGRWGTSAAVRIPKDVLERAGLREGQVAELVVNGTLPPSTKTIDCILVDQIRSIDRAARIFRHIGAAPGDVLQSAVARLTALLQA